MVLQMRQAGLYCPAGDFYIDPWRRVERALITHAHADHARWGHDHYLATPRTVAMLYHRLGQVSAQSIAYDHILTIGGAKVSFHPAGHLPGSAQIRVEVGGEVWVVSGDYKTEHDGAAEAFAPIKCHTFISECTFGLPAFHWQPQAQIFDDINSWWSDCAKDGIIPVLGAYSLGKAQRILAGLNSDIGPIFTHPAVEGTTEILRQSGLSFPTTRPVTKDVDKANLQNAIIIAPPSAMASSWVKKLGPISTGFASGWMGIRGIRRRRAADRGFVISDHADWDGLNTAIAETGAETIYVTHGYTEIFAKWLSSQGYDARSLDTEFQGEEDAGEDST